MLGEHDFIDKRWMYEESLRVPFIVRYPGYVKAGSNIGCNRQQRRFCANSSGNGRHFNKPEFMQGTSFLANP